MLGKILLLPAPTELVLGWEGRVIYRKSGIFVIKKVIRRLVYYYDAELTIPPADNDCIVGNPLGFYQPVVYMPQLHADHMYQELNYHYWKYASEFIGQASGAYRSSDYKVCFVYVKGIKQDGVRIGARSPIQQCIRSGPRLIPSLGQ